MVEVNLTDPIFNNEDAARAHLELIRWPNGPFSARTAAKMSASPGYMARRREPACSNATTAASISR